MLRAVVIGTATAVVLAMSGCSGESGTAPGPSASAPRGGPVELQQGAWWTWASAEPEGSNPVVDGTGEFCERNQPDDVWFLAGTFGGAARRHCTVPAGRPLVAPVVNRYSGDPRECADFMASATGSVELDGKPLQVERIESEPITFQAAAGNAVTGNSARVRATGCGLWVRLPPLSGGRHQLRIRGGAGDFTTSVDYELELVESSV